MHLKFSEYKKIKLKKDFLFWLKVEKTFDFVSFLTVGFFAGFCNFSFWDRALDEIRTSFGSRRCSMGNDDWAAIKKFFKSRATKHWAYELWRIPNLICNLSPKFVWLWKFYLKTFLPRKRDLEFLIALNMKVVCHPYSFL